MKYLIIAAGLTLMTAAPLFAQEHKAGEHPAEYLSGLAGFTRSPGSTSGDMLIEGGVRVV